jgi:hypothetical protein
VRVLDSGMAKTGAIGLRVGCIWMVMRWGDPKQSGLDVTECIRQCDGLARGRGISEVNRHGM